MVYLAHYKQFPWVSSYSGEHSATWWRIHVGTRPKSSHLRPDNWRNTFPMVDHESARFLPCTRPLKSCNTNNNKIWKFLKYLLANILLSYKYSILNLLSAGTSLICDTQKDGTTRFILGSSTCRAHPPTPSQKINSERFMCSKVKVLRKRLYCLAFWCTRMFKCMRGKAVLESIQPRS